MKKTNIYTLATLLIISLFLNDLYGQIIRSFEPESNGLGGSSVTNQNAWSSIFNQGCIPFMDRAEVSTALHRKAGLKELGQSAIAASIPIKNYGIGLSYLNSGYSLFKQSRIGLAIGLRISEKMAMGIEIARYSLRLGMNYGKNQAYSGNISVLSKLSKSIEIGAQVQNLNASKLENDLSNQTENLFKIGIRYILNEQTSVVAEYIENNQIGSNLNAGMKYQASKQFSFSIGGSNEPASLSFGSGFQIGAIAVATSMNYSQVFGYEPSISLTILNVTSVKK